MSKAQIKAFARDLGFPLKTYQVDLVHRTIHTHNDSIFYDGARQIFGKTQVQVICLLIFAINGRICIYSAHKKDTVLVVMRRVVALTRKLKGTGVVSKEALSNGFEEIFFTSGGSVHFRTRTDGVAVGLSTDVIVWDEGQMVSRRAVSDMEPSLESSDYPVSIHMGTPPKADEYRLYPDSPFTVAYLNDDPRFVHNGPKVEYTKDLVYTWEDHGQHVMSWRPPSQLKERLAKHWAAAVTENQKEDFFRDRLTVWHRPESWILHEPALPNDKLMNLLTKQGSLAGKFYGGVGIHPYSKLAYVAANDGRQLMIAQEIDLGAGDLEPLALWMKSNARKFKLFRIPNNARGQALAQVLMDKGISKTKIRMVAFPELSSSIARFFRMTEGGEWKVYDRDYVRLALGSFWLDFDTRSGSSYVSADSKEDEALVLALMQASVDVNLTQRARELNGTALSDESSQSNEATDDDGTMPRLPIPASEIVPQRPKRKAMVW